MCLVFKRMEIECKKFAETLPKIICTELMIRCLGNDGKAYVARFENHVYNDYNIYLRALDNH